MTSALAASTIGEGPTPTVLLHGFLGSGRNLRALAVRWNERDPGRRFLLPDLPGHGASEAITADANHDSMAGAVLAAADAAGMAGPLAVVGHSLGGRVALATARVAPARITEVVMLDIAPGPIDPAKSQSRRVLDVLLDAPDAAGDRREMRAFLLSRGLGPALVDWLLMNLERRGERYEWRIDRRALDALHARFNLEDLWPVIERDGLRVRCVRGGRSPYVTDADVARFRAAGCAVDTLPEAGHYVHVDALDALVELLCRAEPAVRG